MGNKYVKMCSASSVIVQSLSRIRVLATPRSVAHQASLSFIISQSLLKLTSNEWVKLLSRIRLFATPWTVAHQAPPSMAFSRQDSWSGLPFPSPGDLPDPGIKPGSPALQADTLPSEPPGKPVISFRSLLRRRKVTLSLVAYTDTFCHIVLF